MNQPIELAQAHQFVFEQPSQRIELNRVVLAQDFGPPGVVSEPGLNLFDFPAPTGGNYARRRRRSRPRSIALIDRSGRSLWSIALVDRGWSGRFRSQGRLPVYFEASRPASATRIGRDRVPDSGWNHFGLSPWPGLLLSVEYSQRF